MEEFDLQTRQQYLAEFDAQHRQATMFFLSELKQTTSVAEYQAAFEDVIDGVPGLWQSVLIASFIDGLRPDLRRELSLKLPFTLRGAFELARTCEARAAQGNILISPPSISPSTFSPPAPATPKTSHMLSEPPKPPSLTTLTAMLPIPTTTLFPTRQPVTHDPSPFVNPLNPPCFPLSSGSPYLISPLTSLQPEIEPPNPPNSPTPPAVPPSPSSDQLSSLRVTTDPSVLSSASLQAPAAPKSPTLTTTFSAPPKTTPMHSSPPSLTPTPPPENNTYVPATTPEFSSPLSLPFTPLPSAGPGQNPNSHAPWITTLPSFTKPIPVPSTEEITLSTPPPTPAPHGTPPLLPTSHVRHFSAPVHHTPAHHTPPPINISSIQSASHGFISTLLSDPFSLSDLPPDPPDSQVPPDNPDPDPPDSPDPLDSSIHPHVEYEDEPQSMTGNGTKRLCSELIELKSALGDEFLKDGYSNYPTFVRVFKDLAVVDSELMNLRQHITSQRRLVQVLENNISLDAESDDLVDSEVEEAEDLDLPSPLARMYNVLEKVDVHLSEHQLDEVLVILKMKGAKLQKTPIEDNHLSPNKMTHAAEISERKARLTEQLTLVAGHPRVVPSELQRALFGLCDLGQDERAKFLLLKYYRSRLANHPHDWQSSKQSLHSRHLMGCLGNKGSVSVRFRVQETSFSLVCGHLALGGTEGDQIHRVSDAVGIFSKTWSLEEHYLGLPKKILNYEVVLLGDVSYQITLPEESTSSLNERKEWTTLAISGTADHKVVSLNKRDHIKEEEPLQFDDSEVREVLLPYDLKEKNISILYGSTLLLLATPMAKPDLKLGEDPWLYKLYEFLEAVEPYNPTPPGQTADVVSLMRTAIVTGVEMFQKLGRLYLISHLEDKVVFDDGGNDTTLAPELKEPKNQVRRRTPSHRRETRKTKAPRREKRK